MLIYTRTPSSKRGLGKQSKTRKSKPQFKPKQPAVETRYRAAGTEHIKSKIDEHLATHDPKQVIPVRYEDEMAAREAAAQEHKKRLAKTVAPAYNKGPYQPVTSEEQAKWIGRK